MNTDSKSNFPILNFLESISQSILTSPVTVVEAPPGTGKTTILPLELLKTKVGEKKICILEPRRIAAKNAATRMSETLGEKVGTTVGYKVRFDSKVSQSTKVEIITDGILIKILLADPELKEYGLIIFDEFHERRMDSDLCYALVRRCIELFRPDLRILVLSATLDGQNWQKMGINQPPLSIPVQSYPHEIFYLGDSPKKLEDRLLDLIPKAVEQTKGDILVFLSGKREIQNIQRRLLEIRKLTEVSDILALHGDLNLEDQSKVFMPSFSQKKKVILSTNLAESSVTVPGVRVVIDSGFQKKAVFNNDSGVTKLLRTRISLSSAKQRAGRSSREAPGITYRLWSTEEELSFLNRSIPEILEADIDILILQIKSWGEDIDQLPLPDKPSPGLVKESTTRLFFLGCLDEKQNLTKLGSEVLRYPLPLRLGILVSLCPLNKMDWFEKIFHLFGNESDRNSVDFLSKTNLKLNFESAQIFSQVKELKKQSQFVNENDFGITTFSEFISFGFLDRIARKRNNNKNEYKIANGKSFSLKSNLLSLPEFILVLNTISFGVEIEIQDYIEIEINKFIEIHKQKLELLESVQTFTNAKGETFLNLRSELKISNLTLLETDSKKPNPYLLKKAIKEIIQKQDLYLEFQKEKETYTLYNRILFLTKWKVFEKDFSFLNLKNTIEDWLFPFINFDCLKISTESFPYYQSLLSLLSYEEKQILEKEAPEYFLAPTGSKIKLEYNENEVELHIKLQELFGITNLPKLAKGKASILVHLLSPAKRPVQITKDLKSFWDFGYHEVKKELKGRYPKHPWPDKPWETVPTKGRNYNNRS